MVQLQLIHTVVFVIDLTLVQDFQFRYLQHLQILQKNLQNINHQDNHMSK